MQQVTCGRVARVVMATVSRALALSLDCLVFAKNLKQRARLPCILMCGGAFLQAQH